MDQNPVVIERTESGKRLIEALAAEGFEVRVAFWAKPTDEPKWYLYLASPFVNEKGAREAYRLVHRLLQETPDLWLDPFEIRVLQTGDSFAVGAFQVILPKVSADEFAVMNPRPYTGMTWYGGSTLGGVDIDGAYIYPPLTAGASVKIDGLGL